MGYDAVPGLWSYDGQAKIAFLPLPPHTSLRRSALQALYRHMDEEIEKLTRQVAEQAEHRPGTQLLMTHLGVEPVTALATAVFLGDPQRFDDGKSLASYTGLIPQDRFSGRRRRLGRISKQGNPLLRFLWNGRRSRRTPRPRVATFLPPQARTERLGEGARSGGACAGCLERVW
jgi:transposase